MIVPADCVETHDLSVEAAREIGAPPQDGDFLHRVFLYHTRLWRGRGRRASRPEC